MKKFWQRLTRKAERASDALKVRQPGAAPSAPYLLRFDIPKTSVPLSVVTGSFHVIECEKCSKPIWCQKPTVCKHCGGRLEQRDYKPEVTGHD